MSFRAVAIALAVCSMYTATRAFADKVSVFNPFLGSDCSDFLKQESSEPFAQFRTGNYILGFVSGAAIYSGEDKMADFDGPAIMDAVKKYCSAHPEDSVMKAAKWLWNTKGGRE